MWDRSNSLSLEYREPCEQTKIMVCSICIPINMHRERSFIKLGKPFERKLYLIFEWLPAFQQQTYQTSEKVLLQKLQTTGCVRIKKSSSLFLVFDDFFQSEYYTFNIGYRHFLLVPNMRQCMIWNDIPSLAYWLITHMLANFSKKIIPPFNINSRYIICNFYLYWLRFCFFVVYEDASY